MKRREDWPERLTEHVIESSLRPFLWGVHDCCMFPSDAILRMTDVDIATDFRGTYTDAEGALRALKRFAGGGLKEAMARLSRDYDLRPVAPLKAQRGDLCRLDAADFDADPRFGGLLAICSGEVVTFACERGLIHTQLAAIRDAWHV